MSGFDRDRGVTATGPQWDAGRVSPKGHRCEKAPGAVAPDALSLSVKSTAAQFSGGDQAGSEAKPGVGMRRSLRPVTSTE